MQTPETEPAPFGGGDRVIYRPRPAGIETIELIEHRREGWAGWYIRTRREVGPTGTSAHRYDRCELFELFEAAESPAAIETPIGVSRLRRLFRRLFRGRARMREVPAAERAGAVAGWPPVDRGGLAGLDRAVGDDR
jgi:hypothetical protein